MAEGGQAPHQCPRADSTVGRIFCPDFRQLYWPAVPDRTQPPAFGFVRPPTDGAVVGGAPRPLVRLVVPPADKIQQPSEYDDVIRRATSRQHNWKVAGCRPERTLMGGWGVVGAPHQCFRADLRLRRGISTGQVAVLVSKTACEPCTRTRTHTIRDRRDVVHQIGITLLVWCTQRSLLRSSLRR